MSFRFGPGTIHFEQTEIAPPMILPLVDPHRLFLTCPHETAFPIKSTGSAVGENHLLVKRFIARRQSRRSSSQ